jgi:hypothetical protein
VGGVTLSQARTWKQGQQERDRERREIKKKRRYEKLDAIDAIKLAHGCADCGYNEHACALDFDHRPGTEKVAGVANLLGGSWDVLWNEIDKCDVVCSNCHRVRTKYRMENPDE